MSDAPLSAPAEAQPAAYSDISQNDQAIITAKVDRKKFIAALDAGTLACLPDDKGFADTQAARNVINNTVYQGSGQLLLKDFQQQNKFPTAEFLAFDQIEKAAAFSNERIFLKKGSKGISLNFSKDGEQKSVRLFNIAQVVKPELIREYAEYRAQQEEAFQKQRLGENYQPKNQNAAKPALSCASSEPAEYLGRYLAALADGRKFKVSPKLAEEFKEKTKNFIFEKNSEGHINPFNLNRLGGKASAQCKQILSELRENAQKEQRRPAPEHSVPSMSR
jgi:hypothetical protein